MKIIRTISLILFCCIFFLQAKTQTDFLNSDAMARAVAYLDFNGAVVRGSIWNTDGSEIDARPAELDPAAVKIIHATVSSYFKLFNLNVSTDPAVYARAPVNQRIHIIITPDGNWYGHAAGVSVTGSFTWGDDTPGWVFSNELGGNTRYIAAEIAHQIGHSLGLQHQSLYNADQQLITETNGGENHPLDDNAPLMGVPYYKAAGWISGPTPLGADKIQNDTLQIAGAPNNLGYRTSASDGPLPEMVKAVQVAGKNAEGLLVHSSGTYQYRLFDISGKLLRQGALRQGENSIASDNTAGILLLQWFNTSTCGTEKIIR